MNAATKTSATPGPWEVVEDIDGDFNIKSGDWYIAMTCGGVGKHDQEDPTKANAYLIAAAPDLLSALRRLRTNFDLLLRSAPVRDVAETRAEVDAAIAKAEGETK